MKSVKSLDNLQTLEQELGQAILAAVKNIKLAFGSASDPLGWTAPQQATYLLGAFPVHQHHNNAVLLQFGQKTGAVYGSRLAAGSD